MYKVMAGSHTFVTRGLYAAVISAIGSYERDAEGGMAFEDGHFTDRRPVTVIRLRRGSHEPDKRYKPVAGYVGYDRRDGCYRFETQGSERSRVLARRLAAWRW